MKTDSLKIGLVLFFFAALELARWWYLEISITPISFLIFLPAVLCFIKYYLKTELNHRAWDIFLIAIIAITFIVSAVMILSMEVFGQATAKVTRGARYQEIRKKCSPYLPVGHFPISIPKNAVGTQFSYIPGFLQGGTDLRLKYSLPKAEIIQLYEKFKAQSIPNGDTTFVEFPNDYEIMVLNPMAESQKNHGKNYGIAISKSRSSIIYWAESW